MSLSKFKHVISALDDLTVAEFEEFAHVLWDSISSLDNEVHSVGDYVAVLEGLVDDVKQAAHKEAEQPVEPQRKPTKRRTVIVEPPCEGECTRGRKPLLTEKRRARGTPSHGPRKGNHARTH